MFKLTMKSKVVYKKKLLVVALIYGLKLLHLMYIYI